MSKRFLRSFFSMLLVFGLALGISGTQARAEGEEETFELRVVESQPQDTDLAEADAAEITRETAAQEELYTLADPADTIYNGRNYSPVYSYEYYRFVNPDLVAVLGDDAGAYIKHFITWGMDEGRKGNGDFDVFSYRRSYPDLRRAFGSHLSRYYNHYLNSGIREGRSGISGVSALVSPVSDFNGISLSEVYDFNYYMDKYPDLKRVFADDDIGAARHFFNNGLREGRTAKASYNYDQYNRLKRISEHKPSAPTAIYGIDLSPIYDYSYYAWKYPDVAVAYSYDAEQVLNHFATFGMKEGRVGRASFDQGTFQALKDQMDRAINVSGINAKMLEVANNYNSSTGWIILVDKDAKHVLVARGKRGSYGVVSSFPCAIGANSSPTPSGMYKVGAKGLYFNTGTVGRCWYYTQIKGNYLFHSQIYDRSPQPVRILDDSMGVAVSHGCIRLELANAKWMYDTVPTGSTIVVY